MEATVNNGIEEVVQRNLPAEEDFLGDLLASYGFEFVSMDYYLVAGRAKHPWGWMLDLSVVVSQVLDCLRVVLPILKEEGVAFKVAMSRETVKAILNGQLGYAELGRVLSIACEGYEKARRLAEDLLTVTGAFKGPKILTDRHLGGIVYTRYGAFDAERRVTADGQEGLYALDGEGRMLQDQYSIPFVLPAGVSWPFGAITGPVTPKPATILQDRYRSMVTLKEDARGDVKKAFRLVKWWLVKWCVVKEGKENMFSDGYGRDIRDRLEWQFVVMKELEGQVPIPEVYDFFEENGNVYLAMEYLKGESLSNAVAKVFRERHWQELTLAEQLQLMDWATESCDLLQKVHDALFVHRDFTPENIFRSTCLKLIDLELTFSLKKGFPNPPFRLGTVGFMSPEQEASLTPTYQEDIYALGACLIAILTGLLPNKFYTEDLTVLREQLAFYVPAEGLVSSIVACFDKEPNRRPGISLLRSACLVFRKEIVEGKYSQGKVWIDIQDERTLSEVAKASIRGLVSGDMITPEGLWWSPAVEQQAVSYYQSEKRTVQVGYYSGLSGICSTLAQLHGAGVSIRPAIFGYQKSMSFIREAVRRDRHLGDGLYSGIGGPLFAMLSGIRAGLIKIDDTIQEDLRVCLEQEGLDRLGVAKGVSGKGLVLLSATEIIPDRIIKAYVDRYVDFLLEKQQRDGSWLIRTDDGKDLLKMTGFDHGIAGILCFLVSYGIRYNEATVSNSISKALGYLTKCSSLKSGRRIWRMHNKTKSSDFGLHTGVLGIAMSFIQGYRLLGEPRLKEIAVTGLRNYANNIISRDLTLGSGVVGLGEVLLDASTYLGGEEWMSRARWISKVLSHQFQVGNENGNYWIPATAPYANADLFFGNAGIIHFLHRCAGVSSLANALLLAPTE